jgi:hypothetical protein
MSHQVERVLELSRASGAERAGGASHVRPDAPEHLAALAAAVARVEAPPARVLDLGTGRRISGQVQRARATRRLRAFPITRTGSGGGGLVRSGGSLT